jgi:hypothetical protein
LFDLLQGKINETTFKTKCAILPLKFHDLYQLGYCKWTALALLKSFKAKSIGGFTMPFSAREQSRGLLTKERPRLIDVDFMEFNSNKPFVSPDFAAYSNNQKCLWR